MYGVLGATGVHLFSRLGMELVVGASLGFKWALERMCLLLWPMARLKVSSVGYPTSYPLLTAPLHPLPTHPLPNCLQKANGIMQLWC